MSQVRGSFIVRTSDGGGASESLYSANPNETTVTMMNKLIQLSPLREKLSYTDATSLKSEQSAVNPLSVDYLRTEDALIRRDGNLMPWRAQQSFSDDPAAIDGNWSADWTLQLQVKGTTPNTGSQIFFALLHIHGVPKIGTNNTPAKNATLNTTLRNNLTRFVNQFISLQFGFRSYAAWQNSTGAITGVKPAVPAMVVYDAVAETYNFTVPWVVPAVPFTVGLFGMRALSFLNGRHAAVPITPGANGVFQIVRRRYPNVPWDKSGTAGPIQYVVVPAQTIQYLGLHRRKVGRPFGQYRGRARVLRA